MQKEHWCGRERTDKTHLQSSAHLLSRVPLSHEGFRLPFQTIPRPLEIGFRWAGLLAAETISAKKGSQIFNFSKSHLSGFIRDMIEPHES